MTYPILTNISFDAYKVYRRVNPVVLDYQGFRQYSWVTSFVQPDPRVKRKSLVVVSTIIIDDFVAVFFGAELLYYLLAPNKTFSKHLQRRELLATPDSYRGQD